MRLNRRQLLRAGGGIAAILPVIARAATSPDVIEVVMQGRDNGAHVWFDPVGILVQPGQTIRWINRDAGNSHTATAYHPGNYDRPQRIPQGAASWDSDFLLPDESFSVSLSEPGVYDYYCIPHEHAGMVGRIIVAGPHPPADAYADAGLPAIAASSFPSIERIMAERVVRSV